MVVKHLRSANFTTLPNELLRDRRLRWKDIGLLAQMLSRPPDWNFSYSGLLKGANGEKLGHGGRGELEGIVDRLQELGYLKINQSREGGKFGTAEWIVTDKPFLWENVSPPYPEKPYPEKPDALFRGLKNKELLKTDGKKKEPPSQAKPNAAQDGGHRLLAGNGELYLDTISNEWRRVSRDK